MNMGNQIGGTLTASLTPAFAAQYGWTASFLIAAGLCALGALAWLFVDPDQPIEADGANSGHLTERELRLQSERRKQCKEDISSRISARLERLHWAHRRSPPNSAWRRRMRRQIEPLAA
jgi:sugar phosphate permease